MVKFENAPISSMMIFTKLFYSQDISPAAIISKSNIWNKL
jgi:hypothetical protein